MTDRIMFIRCLMAMLHGLDVPDGRMDVVLDRIDIDQLATLRPDAIWHEVERAAADQYAEDSKPTPRSEAAE